VTVALLPLRRRGVSERTWWRTRAGGWVLLSLYSSRIWITTIEDRGITTKCFEVDSFTESRCSTERIHWIGWMTCYDFCSWQFMEDLVFAMTQRWYWISSNQALNLCEDKSRNGIQASWCSSSASRLILEANLPLPEGLTWAWHSQIWCPRIWSNRLRLSPRFVVLTFHSLTRLLMQSSNYRRNRSLIMSWCWYKAQCRSGARAFQFNLWEGKVNCWR